MKTRCLSGLCSTFVSLSLAACGSSGAGGSSPGAGAGGTSAAGGSPSGGVGGSLSGGTGGGPSGGAGGSSSGGVAGAASGGAAGSATGGGGSGAATGGSGGVGTGGAASAIEVLATQKYPAKVALDASNVYWNSAELPTNPSLGGLWRLPKQGGTPELLHSAKGMVDFVLDGLQLYTMVQGSAFFDDVVSVSVSSKTVKVLASNEDASRVATDSTHLYWIGTNSKDLKRMPKAGGTVQVLSSALSQPRAIAIDGAFVYVSNDFGNELLRVATSGGSPTKIWTAPSDAGECDLIVPTPGAVFWRMGPSFTAPAAVYELPTGQAQPAKVVGSEKATWLSADASTLYISPAESSTLAWLSSRPLAGGSWTTFAALAYSPSVFAVDATHVYFTSYKAGIVARVPR